MTVICNINTSYGVSQGYYNSQVSWAQLALPEERKNLMDAPAG